MVELYASAYGFLAYGHVDYPYGADHVLYVAFGVPGACRLAHASSFFAADLHSRT